MRREPPAPRFETYPGLESFRDDDVSRKLYAGRDAEKNALLDLVVGEPLVVLFSRSGLGKSSLINAGLMQPLRDRGFFAVVARLTLLSDPIASVILAIKIAAPRQNVTVRDADESSLWQYLNTARFSRDGQPVKLVLVLDQFEELFTRVREAKPEAELPFIHDLADVVRRRLPDAVLREKSEELERVEEAIDEGDASPETRARRDALVQLLYETKCADVKVLLAIREDYLPDLERLREAIPAVFHSMMRLDPLTPDRARDAIVHPAERDDIPGKQPFRWEDAAIAEILAFLKKRTVGRPSGDASIDPAQMQLICHSIDARRKGDVVTAKELGGEKGMTRILKRFYRDTLALFPRIRLGPDARGIRPARTNHLLFHRVRAAIRLFCERGLITRAGHRDSMMRDTISNRFGIRDEDLKRLEAKKLVRSTTRLEREFFELSHDTLVPPLLAASARRRRMDFVLICLFIALIPFAYPAVRDLTRDARSATVMRQISEREGDLSGEDLSGVKIERLNWLNGRAAGTSFRDSSLTFSWFERVDFTGAVVDRAVFDVSTFWYCTMPVEGHSPSFQRAALRSVSMKGANIPGADFTGAELSDVDLSSAVLTDAKFVDTVFRYTVTVTGASVAGADFSGSAWWFASGWSDDQIHDLSARFPTRGFESSPAFRRVIEELEPEKGSANALNNRAWFRASCGAELDQALKDVDEALSAAPDDPDILDTRGYIRLQLGDVAGALEDLRRSAVPQGDSGTPPAANLYHLALAEAATGDKVSAATHFEEAARLGYQPTHERVLTPAEDPLRRVRERKEAQLRNTSSAVSGLEKTNP